MGLFNGGLIDDYKGLMWMLLGRTEAGAMSVTRTYMFKRTTERPRPILTEIAIETSRVSQRQRETGWLAG